MADKKTDPPRPVGAADETDYRLLALIQEDNRLSNARLGEKVGLSTSAVNARLARLRSLGLIAREAALLSPEKLELNILAFVEVLLDRPEQESGFVATARLLDEVLECHHVTGDYSYLLKVRCARTAELEELLTHLKDVPGVVRTRSIIALSSPKETTCLPLRTTVPPVD